jgi:hypothetical protein
MALLLGCAGCAPLASRLQFPNPNDIFVTTGDGDIQKPYTPIGQLIYSHSGFRIPLPILGMMPVSDVDPDAEFRTGILARVKQMGGDGVINLHMNWDPPSNGFLGLGARGGMVTIYGTVVKR